MNVPLSVTPIKKHNKEYLNIWYNQKQKVIPAPVLPYFYSYKKFDIPTAKITRVEKIALSNFQKKQFYKFEFQTRDDLVEARDELEEIHGRGACFESHIKYILRNRIDYPDLFTKLPHTKDLNYLCLDIEQHIREKRLSPENTDRLTSLSWCTNNRQIKSIYISKDATNDKNLLKKFLYLDGKNVNPDIVNNDMYIIYNKSYDLPMMFRRYQQNRINITPLSKNNVKPHIGGFQGVSIEGSIVYDVYDSVDADQSLNGETANRGLKNVSDYHGFETDVEVLKYTEMRQFQGTKKLVDYNKDDVKRTMMLFDIYFGAIEYKARLLKLPLSECLNMSMTDLGIVVLGDLYREHGIIADGDNWSRYPEIFQRKKKPGEPNFQGALVDIFRTGVFQKPKKADYGSMYPKLAQAFNLSPDTTTLLEYEPYDEKGFRIEEEELWYIYHIPDNILQKNITIQVLKKPGFMGEAIKEFLRQRRVHKKRYKESGDTDRGELAKSWTYKTFGNGAVGFGNHGAAHHPYGFAPMAIATVGFGRQCAQLLIDILNELYPKSTIEVDTDGVYFYLKEGVEFDEKRVLEMFNMRIEEKFKRRLDLDIDIDGYAKGYFYRQKNYVLEKEDGTLILHGGALKSSRKNNISKQLINEIVRAKLDQKDDTDIIRRYKKLEFPVEDFGMSITMQMKMKLYKNQNGLVPRLARQAEKEFGVVPQIGNQYWYAKTIHGFRLIQSTKRSEIDTEYYLNEIDRTVKIFHIDAKPVSIKKWL